MTSRITTAQKMILLAIHHYSGSDGRLTPDGQRLATVGFGVDVWDVNTGRAVVPRSTLRVPSRSVAFTADGRTLLLGGMGQTLLTRIESGRISPQSSKSR